MNGIIKVWIQDENQKDNPYMIKIYTTDYPNNSVLH